jgi:hypothetical protein
VIYGAGDGNRIVSPIHKSCDLMALPPAPESNGVEWRQNPSVPPPTLVPELKSRHFTDEHGAS